MPLLYEVRKKWVDDVCGFKCNRCGKEYKEPDDWLEIQEMFYWRDIGGYGSVWGDGARVELVLCQHCAKELFGDFVNVVEGN